DAVRLAMLDFHTQRFSPAEWPETWGGLREGMNERVSGGRSRPMPVAGPLTFEFPRFGQGADGRPAGEQEWLIVELDPDVVRSSVVPELLNRYLSENGRVQYDASIVGASDPGFVIYESTGKQGASVTANADGSIPLMQVRPFGGRSGRRGPPPSHGG